MFESNSAQSSLKLTFPALLSATLAACGGSGGGDTPSGCLSTLTGGNTTISVDASQCAGCSVADANAAIDASATTFALLTYDASGGQLVMRATAQSGVVFPAGNFAGASLFFPRRDQGGFTNAQVTTRTYLNNALREQTSSDTTTLGNLEGAGQTTTYGGTTSMTFDAVEAVISLSGGADEVRVFDFCASR